MFSERKGSMALPCRGCNGIENGRCRNADRWLANAAPKSTRGHQDRFDLWHLIDAHHVVAVEILLLYLSVLDGDAAEKHAGEAVRERPCDLSFDLARIYGKTWIGSGSDPMDLDVVAINGHLGAGRNITAKNHSLGETPEDACRCRFAPTTPFRRGVKNGEMLWMVRHQFAPEFEWVAPHQTGKFVNEAFDENRIVVDSHTAPEA